MPKIVKSYGVNLTDDVFRIKDVMAGKRTQRKSKPLESMPNEADFESAIYAGGEPCEELEPGPGGEQETGTEAEYEEESFFPGGDGGVREEIIQSAMTEASRIMENAIQNAEMKKQEILAGIETEAELIRLQAAEQGRLQGFASVADETKVIAAQVEQSVAMFEGEVAGFEHEYEEQLSWQAFEIASKVLARKLDEDDSVMVDMVDKVVQGVRNEPWIRVEVAQEMTRLMDALIGMYTDQENISVQAAPTPAGSVIVETPSGVIDASLKTQLENLRQFFVKAANAGSH